MPRLPMPTTEREAALYWAVNNSALSAMPLRDVVGYILLWDEGRDPPPPADWYADAKPQHMDALADRTIAAFRAARRGELMPPSQRRGRDLPGGLPAMLIAEMVDALKPYAQDMINALIDN